MNQNKQKEYSIEDLDNAKKDVFEKKIEHYSSFKFIQHFETITKANWMNSVNILKKRLALGLNIYKIRGNWVNLIHPIRPHPINHKRLFNIFFITQKSMNIKWKNK
ncbi:hypothetical protein BpHYR1_005742 [Brachionus plicatilis]|uniref:Uncharacterized protein n=1 Tax=Brachionus plicatilis TaxID=10195 RepID=A0A3M7S2A8_BRAPC|nr:hypothetical protein BpHYR1_005742 [Brachionus plicatilis]